MSPLPQHGSDGGSGGDGSTPRRAARSRRWPLRIGLVALAFVLVAGAALGAYFYQAARSATENLSRTELMPTEDGSAQPPKWEEADSGGGKKGSGTDGGSTRSDGSSDRSTANGGRIDRSGKPGALNVVLMGSDSRDPADPQNNGRSDTLMLLHLDADRQHAYIVSFPRDIYVPIPGHGMNKINAAYSFGGPQLSIKTLQNMLGIEIDHAALVDFDGFIDITEQLGGVTVRNEHAFSAAGYTFPEGQITISGKKALTFVRARYQLPNGDLDRAENQRKVVKAILAEGLSGNTIANPRKFNRFVAGIAGNITVDQKLTDAEIRKLALSLRMNPKDVKQLQAPITGFADVPGVGSVEVVDRVKLDKLGRALRTDTVDDYLR